MIPDGWVHIRPSKVIQLFGGGAFSSSDAQNDGIRWLKIANVGIGRIKWKDESFLPPNFRDKFSQYLLQAPDIVVALTRPTLNNKLKIARMSKNDGIALLNQRVAKIISSKEVNNDFIYQLLRTDEIAYRINASLLGTDPPNLSIKVLDEFWVSLPPLPEQKKIAQILSTWDKAIETLEKLIANSQQKKKALMQQLLTGKKRFPEFHGEWKQVRLEMVAKIIMGSSPSSKAYNDKSVGLPLIQGNADIKKRKSAPRIFTTEITKECDVGDILLSVRAPVGEVAISIHHACIGRGIASIKSNNPQQHDFLYQWLLWHEPRWASLSQGSTFSAVNRNDIRSMSLLLPSSIKEQQKIASALSSTDQEIETWQQELEHLKQEKKALMQQLLTGKRRVKLSKQENHHANLL